MLLKVLSLNQAKKELILNPKFWNVISINSAGEDTGFLVNSRDSAVLFFDDLNLKAVSNPSMLEAIKAGKYKPPTGHQIKKGLEFGRKYWDGPLLVHCFAGISRSSAVAWLILFDKFRDVNFATEFLFKVNPFAYPNDLIIKIGLKLLLRDGLERINIFKEFQNHQKMLDAQRVIAIL